MLGKPLIAPAGDRDAARRRSQQKGHTLTDHVYGIDLAHTHDGYADHDHDFPDDEGALEDNPIWIQDHVTLTSVGIDIGSSGTQVIFSRIHLRRLGEDLSSRYFVVSRETLFQSAVALTPYRSEEHIDEAKLGAIIDEAYDAAGIDPDAIDTGAVILTGEALRRENAKAIAGIIAEKGGEFVCAAAGHHMEAMLAAYGSGAATLSSAAHQRILNIDIGGGTTKLAVVEHGKVVATAAVHVGGRLQVVEAGRIVRLDPAGKYHAGRAGFAWDRGDMAAPADLDAVAEGMADTLIAALTARPLPPDIAPSLSHRSDRRFRRHRRRHVLRRRRRIRLWPRGPRFRRHGAPARPRDPAADRCRRAAVAAAAGGRMHPRHRARRLRIQRAALRQHQLHLQSRRAAAAAQSAGAAARLRGAGDIDPDALAAAIRAHLVAFDVDDDREVALALRWQGAPAYERLAAFAEGIRRGLAARIAARQPIYVMLDGDVAQTLGAILREEQGVESDILVIDGVMLMDFDYIDLGRIRLPSNTVPVTIKSLVFSEDPRGPRPRQRLHHHAHDEHGHHGHAHGHSHDMAS